MMKAKLNIVIVGTGLIGGSMALTLRQSGLANKIIGVEPNPEHAKLSLERKLVDEILSMDEAVKNTDVIILAVPVNVAKDLVIDILDQCKHQTVIDVGSTKDAICTSIANHPSRGRFVATHPMWGTEYSGPEAAVSNGFSGNTVVICEREKTDPDAMEIAQNIYHILGMKIINMTPAAHDIHAAYVSHISHITSFALANTVLEKEKEEEAIFEMASGGFESTVRLAKSNPDMWVSIFQQNRENILDVLNEHISQLKKFKSCFEKENFDYMKSLIENANTIKRIIK